jgi:hypothetical protein
MIIHTATMGIGGDALYLWSAVADAEKIGNRLDGGCCM